METAQAKLSLFFPEDMQFFHKQMLLNFFVFIVYLLLVNFQSPEVIGLGNFVLFYSCLTLCQKYPDMTEPFSPGHNL